MRRFSPQAALLACAVLAPLAACGGGDREPLPPAAPPAEAPLPAAAVPREVLRLAPAPGGALALDAVVATPEARALLLAEVGRRWPGRALRATVAVEPGAPGLWLSEALAVLPYVAAVEGGGLVVEAGGGAAAGGTLTLTGRVPDEAALARLAADAAASVAPPFVVRTPLLVGLAADTSAADAFRLPPPLVEAAAGAEDAAADLRAVLGDAPLSFQPGAAAPAPDAGPALDRAARVLALHPDMRVEVAAPAEGSGSASLDRALAARRTAALADALVARGLDPARVAAAEPGEAPVPGVVFRLRPVERPDGEE